MLTGSSYSEHRGNQSQRDFGTRNSMLDLRGVLDALSVPQATQVAEAYTRAIEIVALMDKTLKPPQDIRRGMLRAALHRGCASNYNTDAMTLAALAAARHA